MGDHSARQQAPRETAKFIADPNNKERGQIYQPVLSGEDDEGGLEKRNDEEIKNDVTVPKHDSDLNQFSFGRENH